MVAITAENPRLRSARLQNVRLQPVRHPARRPIADVLRPVAGPARRPVGAVLATLVAVLVIVAGLAYLATTPVDAVGGGPGIAADS